ncbi:S1 RNA-binding domain-containing protein [Candidatus Nomurabacteria bacterium]|nr:S1 RNA-binding domain-containing protein [Candidatus Nomurabacteria bacterium]
MSKSLTMDDLLTSADFGRLNTGDVVEGTVLNVKKHEVWVDLGNHGIGVVSRRELGHGVKLEEGASVSASVVEPETEEGHALLSLRRASKDKGWDELQKIHDDGQTIEVTAFDANRGGLLVELEGIRGFLPVSQLSADNYPRVSGTDKDEILQKLHGLINKPLKVRVLDVSRKDNKLIFSEKEALKDAISQRFEKLSVGDTVKGVVTGVIDFGAFVNVDGIEGLIHISEISWERIDDPRKHVKVGDQIEAKIIAIDKERLSLSLKQMTADPWVKEVESLKKGDVVEGSVTRITPFGAFVQISPSVEALVHISEIGGANDQANPEEVFKLGETKKFTILEVDKDGRKIALSMK